MPAGIDGTISILTRDATAIESHAKPGSVSIPSAPRSHRQAKPITSTSKPRHEGSSRPLAAKNLVNSTQQIENAGTVDAIDDVSRQDAGAPGSDSRTNSRRQKAGKLFDPRKDDPLHFGVSGSIAPPERHKMERNAAPLDNSGSIAKSTTTNTNAHATPLNIINISLPKTTTIEPSKHPAQHANGASKKRRQPKANANVHAIKEGRKGPRAQTDFAGQLDYLHERIVTLEQQLSVEHGNGLTGNHLPAGQSKVSSDNIQTDRHLRKIVTPAMCVELIAKHRLLSELYSDYLFGSLLPSLPPSAQRLAVCQSIPSRLWQNAVSPLLVKLEQMQSHHDAKGDRETTDTQEELLIDYTYFAYSFYCHLVDNEIVKDYRASWMEGLAKIARVRVSIASPANALPTVPAKKDLTLTVSAMLPKTHSESSFESKNSNILEVARHEGKASVGTAAISDWQLDEKQAWRITAEEWDAKALGLMSDVERVGHHLDKMKCG